MTTKVKVLALEGNFAKPQHYKKMKVFEDEMFALLVLRLEGKLALEWLLEFWDNDNKCKMKEVLKLCGALLQ